jgi:hypothetical protein
MLTYLRYLWVAVGEVFKVMTQVDHDLTTINRFDQYLGLIKKT